MDAVVGSMNADHAIPDLEVLGEGNYPLDEDKKSN
jgi:hypothetical protein